MSYPARGRAAAISLGAIVVAGCWIGISTIGASVTAAPSAQGTGPVDSPCAMIASKGAEPASVLLGETVDVALTVSATCAGEEFPLHIVLVLDVSGSMEGQPERVLKEATRAFVRDLNLEDNPATQVGVVEFYSVAKVRCELTNDSRRILGCINGIRSGGTTAIDAGIREGMQVLNRGRSGFPRSDEIREVMIVLTDGENNAGCPPVEAEADVAKDQDVMMITVCVGTGCDSACLRRAATSPRFFFEARDIRDLMELFEDIRTLIVNTALKLLTVIDTIPDNMQLVVDSDEPPSKEISPELDQITWQTSFVPATGMTFTFRLLPLEVGCHPTNVSATGEFRDNKNREGAFTFPVPSVCVLSPIPHATPVETPATETPVMETPVTPSETPTVIAPTATATPTTGTRSNWIFMPAVARFGVD